MRYSVDGDFRVDLSRDCAKVESGARGADLESKSALLLVLNVSDHDVARIPGAGPANSYVEFLAGPVPRQHHPIVKRSA